jgi:hypothetical protein
VDASDDMTLTIQGAPTANAGSDASICEGSDYTLSGSATNYNSVTWSTAGDGSFDNENILGATYTPGSGDIAAGSVVLTLTAGAVSPCAVDAADDMTLTIQGAPTANAGSDASVCEGSDYTLSGSATNYNSVTWSSTGDGTFDNVNILGATYTPGTNDIANGSVVLTLTAEAISPCGADATDDMTLTIQGVPTANAGSDADICEGSDYTLSGSATNYNSVTWITAGDGTFDNVNLLGATYTPGSADIATGSVVLTLTAEAVSPCAVDATDDMTLSIQGAPTANAGSDADICESDTYTLSGSATNQQSVLWTSGGDGSFDDATLLNATYTPGSADIANGSVVLTLTATAISPCAVNASDDMTLGIFGQPTANAGSDADICETDSYTLSGSATNQQSVLWISSGDGNFDDATLLNATYTPGSNDISNGSVILTLTAVAVPPCGTDATDDMTLSIQAAPTANAGSDATICEGSDFTTSGSASNYSSVSWASTGTGTFANGNTLTATYTPSAADIAAGSVTLTLSASAISPCAGDATDDMTLTIQGSPTANAGTDATICEGSDFTTSGTATNYDAVSWASSGSGTFTNGNTLAATYTPSGDDITAGSVTLTLTATAVSPCAGDASDDMTLSFQLVATADAGVDATICEGSDFTTAGSANNYSSVAWTTSGSGTFTNGNTLTATYTPSAADITAGSVTLTLTASPTAPCTGDATDDMTLSFQLAPTANAGSDASICETGSYTLSGSASNYQSVEWATPGDGTFDDETLLDATYTPGAGDIANGSVVLTLTAVATSPCSVDASDDMTLSIFGQPTAGAGADGTVCEDASYTLSGTASNQGSVLWETSGDGTFDNATLLDATYTPGTNDLTAGTVTLTITAYAVPPCGTDATDDMTLTIQDLPTVFAGADAGICEDASYTLSGSANDQFSIAWTTSGDGTFDDPVLLAATYTPGTNDISNGSVVLTLTATSVPPCNTDVSDDMTLSIQSLPTANAGPDDVVDAGSDYTLSGSASNQQSVLWTTAGDGTFDDASLLAATYTPGAGDLDNGSVVLTLTASAVAPCSADDADDMTLFFSFTQNMNLTLGWNIMSFYVVPDDPNMLNIVQPLIDNSTLIKVIDENGDFIEFLAGAWVNYIGNMANTEGYYIKVSANTSLDADGTYVIFPFDVALNTGWNMAGYPVKQSQDAMTILQPLIDNGTLIKVMNESGDFIQNIPPYGWLNTIVNFVPGEGYYVKTSAVDVLTYNQPTKASAPGMKPVILPTQHFFASSGNPYQPMNIVIQEITGNGFMVEDGDEIAVYDGDLQVGSAVVHQGYGGLQVIMAVGDDPATESIDGYTIGNTLTFKYWDKSHNAVYDDIMAIHHFGDEGFAGLGTWSGNLEIFALGTGENEQHMPGYLGQNFPNPFTRNTTINYGIYQDGQVLISIYDVSGRRLQIIEDAPRSRGQYSVTFNNSSLEPGMYYYQMEFSNGRTTYSASKKMIVH